MCGCVEAVCGGVWGCVGVCGCVGVGVWGCGCVGVGVWGGCVATSNYPLSHSHQGWQHDFEVLCSVL